MSKTKGLCTIDQGGVIRTMHEYLRTAERYRTDVLRPPFFIELTGSPSSGKSTVIDKLDTYFRSEGFRVFTPQEGARVIRHIPRTTPLYNIRTGLYALEILIDLAESHRYDIVIFDRCIFDVDNWMTDWKGKGQLSQKECTWVQEFFRMRFWVDQITAAYIFVSDPATAVERERRFGVQIKAGQHTNVETIGRLADRYRAMYKRLHKKFPQLELIDTTLLSEQEMVEMMATKVLDAFKRRIA